MGSEGGGEWSNVSERARGKRVGAEGWIRSRHRWHCGENGKPCEPT